MGLINAVLASEKAIAVQDEHGLDVVEGSLIQLGEMLRTQGYRFTTVTPATHTRVNNQHSEEFTNNFVGIFGWSRAFKPHSITPQLMQLMQNAEVVQPHLNGLRSTVRFSTLDDYLFAHSSYPTTEENAVFFGPDTYRFCLFIQNFLNAHTAQLNRAVDIGCGSGAAAVLIAKNRPSAEVLAVDINDSALRLTRVNAALNDAENIIACVSNLLNDVTGEFDLIVANPPYLIDSEKRAYRHGGGALGAQLSLSMVDAGIARLSIGGTLLLYTGVAIINGDDPFLEAIKQRLMGTDLVWNYSEIDPDIFGEEVGAGVYKHIDRIAAIGLTITRPGH
ncbi:MAG: hypothetical protein JWM78_1028 [Verrucomicrobiaceae bacterium]|nr:hypothetical protein [Verrucomicrobiaceae bacterium]